MAAPLPVLVGEVGTESQPEPGFGFHRLLNGQAMVTRQSPKSSPTAALSELARPSPARSFLGKHPYAQLEQYRELAPNWNGWNADPPPDSVFEEVLTVLEQFAEAGFLVRDVTLGVDEIFYVEADGVTVDIYFDGGLVLVLHPDDGETVILEVSSRSIAKHLARNTSTVA